MTSKAKTKVVDKELCPKCRVFTTYTIKMFGTKVCDECNTIISSDIGVDKA